MPELALPTEPLAFQSSDKDNNEVKMWSKGQKKNVQQKWELLKTPVGHICLDKNWDNIQTRETFKKYIPRDEGRKERRNLRDLLQARCFNTV
jgi:hypothetical protein